MKLLPMDKASMHLVTCWLSEKENYQWLDFGGGVQSVNPLALAVMMQRNTHVFRVFTPDADDTPIGLAVFSSIDPNFKTANLWYVLGDKRYAGQGCTTRAVSAMLGLGFRELGLHVVQAWAVERNVASVQVLTRNGFSLAGRLRQCHRIDGVPQDRLLFDLLASEYKELDP